jgi:hypothetical protein
LDLCGTLLTISQAGSATVDISGTGGGGDPSTWSQYPATQSVAFSSFDITGVNRTESGIVRVGLLEPQLGGSYIDIITDVSSSGSASFAGDVDASEGSLNSTILKTNGITSYDAGARLTTFETGTLPFVAGQGLRVYGDVVVGVSDPGKSVESAITAFDPAGIYSKLGIVPTALGMNPTTVNYGVVGGPPSDWIPDNQPPTLGADNSWRHIKPAGAPGVGIKINWAMYNPYFGQALPYTVPASPAILRKNLNAVWAVIRPNANIAVQGAIFFNIFTYDVASPPGGAFTSRWDYNANNLALPLTTGAQTLCAGFKYLIYCYDAPKIVATPANLTTIAQANGQYPTQTYATRLNDPYDIYTDIPHIPFSAVSLHPNPQTAPIPLDVQVSGLALNTTSSSLTAGLDFDVIAMGYKAEGYLNYEYLLEFA